MRVAIPIAAAWVLAACGQTGALYLPDEGVETPVEIRTTTEPAQAPAPETAPESAPDSEDKEKEKSGPPPAP